MIKHLCSALTLALATHAGGAGAGMLDLINGKMVGKQLPYAEVQFIGDKVQLENQVVLIDFWAAWCEACRDLMPRLNQLHSDYADQGLVVVGLTQDRPADIAALTQKIPMYFHIARDARGVIFKSLKVRAMPYAILVDKRGRIIWQGDPAELNKAQLEELLKTV